MIDDILISKVQILIQQDRFKEAEKMLAQLLAQAPNHIHLLSLMAEVKLQQDKLEDAESIINNAIGVAPDEPYLFYVKTRIALLNKQPDEAEFTIQQAIQLDPNDAHYHAMFANVKLMRKQYEKALEIANTALAIDAENLLALNVRSTALLKLDDSEAAFVTVEGALREDPNNAYTHANYGWGLLEKGNHKKALEHFKEALKSDPNYEYAQAGMMEAIKASNPVYRLFLKYAFFMGNLTAKYQWGVIIGFYIGMRVLRTIADSNPAIQPYLTPLIILLAIFAFSTWVISPISNLFLRFNPYGKMLLSEKEKMSSNFVAVSFGLFVIGALAYLATFSDQFLTVSVFGFAMMLPLGVMFSPTKQKNALVYYTAAMAGVGLLAIGTTFSTGELFNTFTTIFIFGFIAFQWIANYLMIDNSDY